MGGWGTAILCVYIWLQRFNVCFFLSCLALERLRAHPNVNCSCGSKNPLEELLSHFSPQSRQLGYENAENVELLRQAGMQTQRGEPRKAAPWQRGRQSRALSLLRRVQHRKMFLECVCDSSSQAHCPGASINTAAAKIPNELKQNKTRIHGNIAIQEHAFPS